MSKPEAGPAALPRNYVQPCVLLLLAESPSHGYELLDRMAELGLTRTDPGGLYRTLRAMEQDGHVRSRWEHSAAGPARRTYAITEDGGAWLRRWAESLGDVHQMLGAYLERYARLERQNARP
jgi:poly-beta-hydroxybutyrate-responsive repressor